MLLLFPYLFTFFAIPPQEAVKPEWKKSLEIKKKAVNISTDRLGNLYLIKENNIWLYNNQGDSIAAFNSRKYGEISYVDTTDPYKILVFFQDYGIIIFLDNYLSVNGDPINLQDLGFDRVSIACLSRENGFWVFDQLRQKAYHLDDNFKITHETVNLTQWFNKTFEPTNLLEYNNQLFLSDDEALYIFDHFGTYTNKHPLKNIDHLQFIDDKILYMDSGKFCEYNLKKIQTNCVELPKANIQHARMEKNRLFISGEKSVSIFQRN